MKKEIMFSCGHTGVVNLYGNAKQRADKAVWYEEYGVCPECWQKQQQSIVKEKSQNLIHLQGSDKQVAWAESIRVKTLEALTNYFREMILLAPERQQKVICKQVDLIMLEAKAQDKATFWIDCRNMNSKLFVKSLLIDNPVLQDALNDISV